MHSIAAGEILEVGSFTITNTMFAGMLTAAFMIFLAIVIRMKLSLVPGKIQGAFEFLYFFMYDLTEQISDKKRAKIFFPLIFGFFMFILISNYMGNLPFYGEAIVVESNEEHNIEEQTAFGISPVSAEGIEEEVEVSNDIHQLDNFDNNQEYDGSGLEVVTDYPEAILDYDNGEKVVENHSSEGEEESHGVPLLRGATSDMNYTMALSAVSFIAVLGFGIFYQKPPVIGFVLHYFQPGEIKKMKGMMKIAMIPLFGFVGFLEMLLEPLKAISLSFRLFGNVYAGEVLILAMTTIGSGNPVPFIAIPFYLLEFLVAFIQAFVFSLLTLVFISLVTPRH